MLDSHQEVLIQAQSDKGDFLAHFVYILFKKFKYFYMFQNKFADFKNRIVLHIVIFNMNSTSLTVVRIVTGLKYFSHY